MPMLDLFEADDFNSASLTASLNKAPYSPGFLGSLGMFREVSIRTTTATVEDKQGRLGLVPTAARGTMPTTTQRAKRTTQSFKVPHMPLYEEILAEDVQDVRAFGSETELETLAEEVNDRLESLRADHEVTFEYQRSGAIQGKTLDADLTTEIYDFFTAFGVTRTAVNFELSNATADMKTPSTSVIRAIQKALGATPFTGIIGIAGDEWWDEFIIHPSVKEAYERWEDGHLLRTQQTGGGNFVGPGGQQGFMYNGILYFNYRAAIGDNNFVPTAECQFFPTGVRDLFQHVMAPADFEETVNTRGLMMYAKQERMDFDKGRKLHSQANALILPTRPACLIQGTKS